MHIANALSVSDSPLFDRPAQVAADEMIQRTSTDRARWNVVAGNDKRWARVEVLKIVCRAMTKALER